jgi:hypothetical protein
MWAGGLLVVAAVVFVVLGVGVGDDTAPRFSSGGDVIQRLMAGFNWTVAVLAAGPFVVAAAIALAASWMLAAHDISQSTS